MKTKLSKVEWCAALDKTVGAVDTLAEIASLLDLCAETEETCNEAKRIEMELCILESRLRRLADCDRLATRTGSASAG
jgi:hypothetical protein